MPRESATNPSGETILGTIQHAREVCERAQEAVGCARDGVRRARVTLETSRMLVADRMRLVVPLRAAGATAPR